MVKEQIKLLIKHAPKSEGIYKMLGAQQELLYIGKAKNLKARLNSYTNNDLPQHTINMLKHVKAIEWIQTNSELNALLLEADLIKSKLPKYNIDLKDDKSFPYIKIDTTHNFPRIYKYRNRYGNINPNTFGPFTKAAAVGDFIKLVQKIFKIRTCTNSFFKNRVSPCILYQIKMCSAPCVNFITQQEYQNSISALTKLLNGNQHELKNILTKEMLKASNNLDFELAISLRDQISLLNYVTSKSDIMLHNSEDADFFALAYYTQNELAIHMIQIVNIKNGHIKDIHYFDISNYFSETKQTLMLDVIIRYYRNISPKKNIYINIQLEGGMKELIKKYLFKKWQINVEINIPTKKIHKEIMNIAEKNAYSELELRNQNVKKWQKQFNQIGNFLSIKEPITTIEIYDNSHLYGTLALGVMVRANIFGFERKSYRVFHTKNNVKNSDDYAIFAEIFKRRFKDPSDIPDLIFIDGGKGQLSTVLKSLNKMQINTRVCAIAKGAQRNANQEKFYMDTKEEIIPNNKSAPFLFIQKLRNEAHRKAIQSLRQKKLRELKTSELDKIPGISKVRKQMLLHHFTSLNDIKNASIKELSTVPKIDKVMAKKIFNWFH